MSGSFYNNSILAMRTIYLLLGVFFLVTLDTSVWYYPVLGYIFVALCNGVASHKYFCHKQFEVNDLGKILLAFFSTVGAYSPVAYWIIQHTYHHRHSDDELDNHSPRNGFWNSAFLWPFKNGTIELVFQERAAKVHLVKIKKDEVVTFFSKYFVHINLLFIICLGLVNWKILCYFYFPGYVLETVRIGLINSLCHSKFIGGYRNHDTPDNSHNNYLIGIITLGFSWHNNHHANPSKLGARERWWEFDMETAVAKGFRFLFPISK